jgi:dienelactone hydrolase
VRAFFAGHPSMLSLPADAAAVRKPLSVAVGSKDDALGEDKVKEIKRVLEGLQASEEGVVVQSEVVVYDGAGHGFCIRLDRHNEGQARQAEEAEEQAVRWFERFL